MSKTITQRELRNDSGGILRAVEAGESFIVTRNGVAAAELRPLRRRIAVPRDQALRGVAHLPRIDLGRLRSDVDALLDQDVEPQRSGG
jgi:prevent-host-death family protein